jgi:TRAP-type C4-dicarboxylate transport system permease small subunit
MQYVHGVFQASLFGPRVSIHARQDPAKQRGELYTSPASAYPCLQAESWFSMKNFLDTLFRGIEILMAFFLTVMIVLVFLNVVLRYIFSTGFASSEEIARLCFIYLVYLGAIGAMRDNQHLIIDSILSRVPSLYQKILYFLVQAGIIWVMAILTTGSWQLVIQNLGDRWVATQFPIFLVYGVGLITGISITLIALANLYRLIVFKMPVSALLSIRDESGQENLQ